MPIEAHTNYGNRKVEINIENSDDGPELILTISDYETGDDITELVIDADEVPELKRLVAGL